MTPDLSVLDVLALKLKESLSAATNTSNPSSASGLTLSSLCKNLNVFHYVYVIRIAILSRVQMDYKKMVQERESVMDALSIHEDDTDPRGQGERARREVWVGDQVLKRLKKALKKPLAKEKLEQSYLYLSVQLRLHYILDQLNLMSYTRVPAIRSSSSDKTQDDPPDIYTLIQRFLPLDSELASVPPQDVDFFSSKLPSHLLDKIRVIRTDIDEMLYPSIRSPSSEHSIYSTEGMSPATAHNAIEAMKQKLIAPGGLRDIVMRINKWTEETSKEMKELDEIFKARLEVQQVLRGARMDTSGSESENGCASESQDRYQPAKGDENGNDQGSGSETDDRDETESFNRHRIAHARPERGNPINHGPGPMTRDNESIVPESDQDDQDQHSQQAQDDDDQTESSTESQSHMDEDSDPESEPHPTFEMIQARTQRTDNRSRSVSVSVETSKQRPTAHPRSSLRNGGQAEHVHAHEQGQAQRLRWEDMRSGGTIPLVGMEHGVDGHDASGEMDVDADGAAALENGGADEVKRKPGEVDQKFKQADTDTFAIGTPQQWSIHYGYALSINPPPDFQPHASPSTWLYDPRISCSLPGGRSSLNLASDDGVKKVWERVIGGFYGGDGLVGLRMGVDLGALAVDEGLEEDLLGSEMLQVAAASMIARDEIGDGEVDGMEIDLSPEQALATLSKAGFLHIDAAITYADCSDERLLSGSVNTSIGCIINIHSASSMSPSPDTAPKHAHLRTVWQLVLANSIWGCEYAICIMGGSYRRYHIRSHQGKSVVACDMVGHAGQNGGNPDDPAHLDQAAEIHWHLGLQKRKKASVLAAGNETLWRFLSTIGEGSVETMRNAGRFKTKLAFSKLPVISSHAIPHQTTPSGSKYRKARLSRAGRSMESPEMEKMCRVLQAASEGISVQPLNEADLSQQTAESNPAAGASSSNARPNAVAGPSKGIQLGLENMRILMGYLPAMTVPYIHLAGTNGKGSVSAMLDSCLRSAGFRTGRYNSPHLVTIRDSILINGFEVSQSEYAARRAEVQLQISTHSLTSSEFEITTATAFNIFARQSPPLDVLIIECGMGGLRDATNVLPKEHQLCSVLTMVDLDHQGFLGNTVEEIAADKCGIMAEGGVMIVGRQAHESVLQVVEEKAHLSGTNVVYAGWEGLEPGSAISVGATASSSKRKSLSSAVSYVKPSQPSLCEITIRGPMNRTTRLRENMPVPLPGGHQNDNTALAVSILFTLNSSNRATALLPRLNLNSSMIRTGLERTEWKGRCSWVTLTVHSTGRRLEVLLDGAHNTAASTQLRSYIDLCTPSPITPVTYIVGLSHSPPKTPLQVLRPLLKPGDRVAIVPFSTPIEGMPWIQPVGKEQTLEAVLACGIKKDDVATEDEVDDLSSAIEWATQIRSGRMDGLVVVTGSLYLVADVYRLQG